MNFRQAQPVFVEGKRAWIQEAMLNSSDAHRAPR
jgi:hypothetical protein